MIIAIKGASGHYGNKCRTLFLVTFIEQFASNFNEEILYEEYKQKSQITNYSGLRLFLP